MEADPLILPPGHLQCRLLYSFHFARRQQQAVAQRLETRVHDPHPVWQAGRTRYDDRDFLEPVRQLLFGGEQQGLIYRQVNPDLIQRWFRHRIRLCTPQAIVSATLAVIPGIELFLAPYGVGVLSLTLTFERQVSACPQIS